ncbi:MAG: molybdate ABC transporter substrate-binding protein, partial [Desulfobacteraceae bacterium]|nr:molybdate ABC transporter substrate-binding protein [Desulfobacteraceae bacterium]
MPLRTSLLRSACLLLTGLVVALSAPGRAGAETELLVSAAASLTESFREIGPLFAAQSPGIEVKFNFAASGPLLQQIAQGAPVDVFAAADQETMDRAEKGGYLLAGSRADFVGNTLVLVTPPGVGLIKGMADLGSSAVRRIAIGNPDSVPAGRYAREALEKQGAWQALAPKYVPALSVKQALEYVQRGEVDAGFVYASDALAAKNRVRVA